MVLYRCSFHLLVLRVDDYDTWSLRVNEPPAWSSASLLLQPNPIFVQYIKVESLDSKSGVMLYGTYGTPALDVFTIWTETRNVTVPSEGHEGIKASLSGWTIHHILKALFHGTLSMELV
ncbi:E3 ubiquitin-protein ligase APD1-like [Prosopis cineraria]|uniref:E3 ubiquitin-protein ligase APD1-like n=1 Tax=Prosopis cineraria TaxID=364024 RepID=UPI00241078AA|nr:E3 ubiquitin-protein ligase APD1-like [Prosopis cineraria]